MSRVLLVDDEQEFLDFAQGVLQSDPRFAQVLRAATGEEALALLARHAPSLVVMDVLLREQNGFSIARRMLRLQPDVQILLTSAYDELGYTSLARDAGALGFLPKRAFSADAILEAIGMAPQS